MQAASCVLLAAAAAAAPASREEALARAFPGATVERRALVLTPAQRDRVKILSGEAPAEQLVVAYEATRDGRPTGTAYFDIHRVRTLPQAVLFVVDPEGRLAAVDVVAFGEPAEYRASPAWLGRLRGRVLDDELHLRRGVDGITGATLTAGATVKAARRVLAVHRVLRESPP
jgi:hypothetical protein